MTLAIERPEGERLAPGDTSLERTVVGEESSLSNWISRNEVLLSTYSGILLVQFS